ncbi:hypothetical protein BLNAU_11712 [Blattamonas nauphoetae]|uniref:Uncharacterized protein n=1 Tax=Blattamonas nauphoetae TaxID=2049346 RepID=A0ABQ9XNZ6_9EUKA|nr:hypothetical protein BLNAU_11712 [Blattamonas nauphoetae]
MSTVQSSEEGREIMFALVCGFLPFEDQNTQALFSKDPPRSLLSSLLLEKKQREVHDAGTVSKLTPIVENEGEPKGVVKVEQIAPIEGKAKAALSKRKTAAKIVTSNQPSGEAKGANEPAAEEKKESDEKEMETVKKKVTTSKNVHQRNTTVVQ